MLKNIQHSARGLFFCQRMEKNSVFREVLCRMVSCANSFPRAATCPRRSPNTARWSPLLSQPLAVWRSFWERAWWRTPDWRVASSLLENRKALRPLNGNSFYSGSFSLPTYISSGQHFDSDFVRVIVVEYNHFFLWCRVSVLCRWQYGKRPSRCARNFSAVGRNYRHWKATISGTSSTGTTTLSGSAVPYKRSSPFLRHCKVYGEKWRCCTVLSRYVESLQFGPRKNRSGGTNQINQSNQSQLIVNQSINRKFYSESLRLIDWFNPPSEKLPHGDDFRVGPKSDST